ncbi:MAG: hypothetical protein QOJ34_98, partial [Pseudonocardiales bacterium]|nr:hypothetical protein [Pseudonocardiales bacterium]
MSLARAHTITAEIVGNVLSVAVDEG